MYPPSASVPHSVGGQGKFSAAAVGVAPIVNRHPVATAAAPSRFTALRDLSASRVRTFAGVLPAIGASFGVRPVALPFTGITSPNAVAVDTAGNVYIVSNKQVLKLAAGSTTPTTLPFTDLVNPADAAVDTAGNVYVADFGNGLAAGRALKLAAGSTTPTTLPFTGLNQPAAVGVDSAGNVYVTDSGNNRVLKLAAGSTTPITLPFTGLNNPDDVAVDTAGAVFVADGGNNRVLKLAPQ